MSDCAGVKDDAANEVSRKGAVFWRGRLGNALKGTAVLKAPAEENPLALVCELRASCSDEDREERLLYNWEFCGPWGYESALSGGD